MLFASTFTLGKAALAYSAPIFLIAIRMLIGGSLLLTYQYFFRHKHWHFRWNDLGLLTQVSFFSYYGAFILEFWSLQWLTSSKACLLFNLAPFITALISFILFREMLNIRKCIGLIIGFVGFMPILMATARQEEAAGSISWLSLPEFALIGAVFCASYGWIVLKQLRHKGYSIIMINGLTMTAAGIAALITSWIIEGTSVIFLSQAETSIKVLSMFGIHSIFVAEIMMFATYTLLLIFIANIVAFNLYGYLLSFYSATFLSFAGFITPLFAALFGWLFLDETIGLDFMLSSLIVFLGLFLFYKEELKMAK